MNKILFIVGALILVIVGIIFFADDSRKLSADIHFSDDNAFQAEKEHMDDMISSLDDILFLDMKRDEERSWYYLDKSSIALEDTHLHLIADHLIDDDSEATYSMDVSNSDVTIKRKIKEADKTFTTTDGKKVYLSEDDTFKFAYFQSGDMYYTVTAQQVASSEEELTWDMLKEAVEEMREDTPLAESVKSVLTKKSKDNFIMPDYFLGELDLNKVSIDNNEIALSYGERVKAEGSDSKNELEVGIEYSVSDEAYRYDADKSNKESLSNNTKADLIVGYDSSRESSTYYRQNVLFFDDNNLHFRVHATNIENPINNKDVGNLLKIANSVGQ